jgi:hypothetical protein
MSRTNVGLHVGFVVGFWGLPDKGRLSGINRLNPICRECRVFTGVESAGDSEKFSIALKPGLTYWCHGT